MARGGHNRIDLTGRRFGRLVVAAYAKTVGKTAHWSCVCDCGSEKVIAGGGLKLGTTRSCGCLQSELTVARNFRHGLRRHPRYQSWVDMHFRCYNEKSDWFADYGGRGICVCEEWHAVQPFLEWCDQQNPPVGHTIDRRDVNGNYSPDNCHFITPHDQNRNMRSNVWVEWPGGRMILKDFVAAHGVVSYDVAKKRVRVHGWDPYKAATTPNLGRSGYQKESK